MRIFWWNTGLCHHRGRHRNYASQLEKCVEALRAILRHDGADILCLGEIDAETASCVWQRCFPSGYAFRDLDSNNNSKSKYRISLFWKQKTVTLRQHSPEHCFIDGNNHKVAVRVDVNLFDGLPISVYVTHWTSRLYAGSDARLRGDIAKDLRQRIDDGLQRAAASQVIVMGDFNDNPFDISLTRYLRATRDINEARKDPKLLFNPFWRSLIGVKPYFIGAGTERSSGSYRHKKLTVSHKWHVFDQIIVSHGLLGPSGWHLNELATGVLDQTELHGISLESKSGFDHYPVVALFEKDAQE